jgi:hypothetical protein
MSRAITPLSHGNHPGALICVKIKTKRKRNPNTFIFQDLNGFFSSPHTSHFKVLSQTQP